VEAWEETAKDIGRFRDEFNQNAQPRTAVNPSFPPHHGFKSLSQIKHRAIVVDRVGREMVFNRLVK
jgi:hypothetical protein